MNCPHCQKPIEREQANYCPHCGKSLTSQEDYIEIHLDELQLVFHQLKFPMELVTFKKRTSLLILFHYYFYLCVFFFTLLKDIPDAFPIFGGLLFGSASLSFSFFLLKRYSKDNQIFTNLSRLYLFPTTVMLIATLLLYFELLSFDSILFILLILGILCFVVYIFQLNQLVKPMFFGYNGALVLVLGLFFHLFVLYIVLAPLFLPI